MIYLGVDPGCQGGIVCINDGYCISGPDVRIYPIRFSQSTLRDIEEFVSDVSCNEDANMAVVEKVHSMPGQGVASTFKFGKAYGEVLGVLTALDLNIEHVTPAKWQRAMGIPPAGKKTKTEHKRLIKQRAQELFPKEKIVNEIADAYVIAEYARRTFQKGGSDAT